MLNICLPPSELHNQCNFKYLLKCKQSLDVPAAKLPVSTSLSVAEVGYGFEGEVTTGFSMVCLCHPMPFVSFLAWLENNSQSPPQGIDDLLTQSLLSVDVIGQ